MSAKRKICFFTGTRAEYGLLKNLMLAIRDDECLHLQIIASAAHLSHEFGFTLKEIIADGFLVDEKIEMLLSSDTNIGMGKSIGLGIISYSEALNRLKPDLIFILGDRFEAFACAAAAVTQKIPIAHIHGGEITEGAIDEYFRHAITKLSCLHFTTTAEHRVRVIQMGENPDHVFNVGALGVDAILRQKVLSRSSLEKSLCFKFNKKNLLVTYHPVTLSKKSSKHELTALFSALDTLDQTTIIFTKSNADPGSRLINMLIDEFAAGRPKTVFTFLSLGQLRYGSCMRYVDGVVGNSSSGIIEAPSLKIGTINIGDRQKGRLHAESVIHCKNSGKAILHAFDVLFSDEFKKTLKGTINPYGDGTAPEKIVAIVKSDMINNLCRKNFFDIKN
jgi:GDP/UDP-N,N'-diacetylbacillosamine 2-epimerase (hydrolysing)